MIEKKSNNAWTQALLPWLLLLSAVVLIGACRGADKVEEEATCEDGTSACWAVLQPKILDGSGGCTGCHTGVSDPNGTSNTRVSWDFSQYATIVTDGLESQYPTGGKIVDASSSVPDNSFLHRKLAGDLEVGGSEGVPMPLGGQLSQPDLDLIDEWLSKGSPET